MYSIEFGKVSNYKGLLYAGSYYISARSYFHQLNPRPSGHMKQL